MPGGGCRHAVLAAAKAGAECTGPSAILIGYRDRARVKMTACWRGAPGGGFAPGCFIYTDTNCTFHGCALRKDRDRIADSWGVDSTK